MRQNLITTVFLLVAASSAFALDAFQLPDTENRTVEVAPKENQLTVVCFLGTECPLAKLYAPRLNALAEQFSAVRFIAINSNQQDSLDEVCKYAETHSLAFPMLKDFRNEVADRFDAKRTPEVFVLDGEFAIRYRGRIDDQYTPGVSKQSASRHELREALEALTNGRDVAEAETTPVGCLIGRVREPVVDSSVSYCNQVSRLLQQHCVECHREGEIGPFSLEDYEEVSGWAETMIEVIDEGRMPPWHANPEFGEFTNSRHMSNEAKETLRTWVEAGMPYGKAEDLPEQLERKSGWRLPRDPDLVLSMNKREFVVPEDGTVEYQYFVVDPGFTEDKWVTGAQIQPGNASVLHHSIVFIRPPDGSRFRGIGWLTAYVPGSRAGSYPEGHAIKVPAKSKLVFQQHYTPTGTEQTDLTTLGLTFGKDEEIHHEVYTLVGIDQQFEIPPHAENHVVRSEVYNMPHHATLRSIMPHMHLRGKSFRLFADRGDLEDVLLDVPRYDFNWQHAYQLKEPIPLSSLDRLHFEVAFDNSAANPVNPDPEEHVTWGDQTWEEMAVAFFEVSEPRKKPKAKSSQSDVASKLEDNEPATEKPLTPEQQEEVDAHVMRLLKRFDKNKNGIVEYDEMSLAFRRYAIWEFDQNRDRELTKEEIEQAARGRLK